MLFLERDLGEDHLLMGFLGGASGKKPAGQCRKHKRRGFNSWVGNVPWRKAWQPTPVFLPRESHRQKSLVGYSPYSCTESNTTEVTACTCMHTINSIALLKTFCNRAIYIKPELARRPQGVFSNSSFPKLRKNEG